MDEGTSENLNKNRREYVDETSVPLMDARRLPLYSLFVLFCAEHSSITPLT